MDRRGKHRGRASTSTTAPSRSQAVLTALNGSIAAIDHLRASCACTRSPCRRQRGSQRDRPATPSSARAPTALGANAPSTNTRRLPASGISKGSISRSTDLGRLGDRPQRRLVQRRQVGEAPVFIARGGNRQRVGTLERVGAQRVQPGQRTRRNLSLPVQQAVQVAVLERVHGPHAACRARYSSATQS